MHVALDPARTPPPEFRELAREVFAELIAIDTTDTSGSVTAAAQAVSRRLFSQATTRREWLGLLLVTGGVGALLWFQA